MTVDKYVSYEEGRRKHIGLAVAIPVAFYRCKINLAVRDAIAIGEFYAVIGIDEISPDFPI